MGLFVDQPVVVAVDGGIDSKREDVLVVCSQYSRMHDGSPGYLNALVDGLSAYDTGSSHLVLDLSGLIEDEGHNVLVVGNGDDRLNHELPVTNNGGLASSIIGMFPANAGILFVDTYHVLHVPGLTFLSIEDSVKIVD